LELPFYPPRTNVRAIDLPVEIPPPPPEDEMTPLPSMVIVVPSTLTPPKTDVLAVGNVYPPVDDMTPPLIVMVVPSTLTVPETDVLATGNVQLVKSPLVGVPNIGVTNVGDVAKTLFPLPVEVVTPVPPLSTGRAVPDNVTANVPELVIGDPATDRNVGTVIATDVTDPLPPPTADITPEEAVIVVPSTFTAPKTDVLALGNVQFVSVPLEGVPKAPPLYKATSAGYVTNTSLVPAVNVTKLPALLDDNTDVRARVFPDEL
jgi:hypothetical protein